MRPSPAPRSLTQDLHKPPGEARGQPPNRSLPCSLGWGPRPSPRWSALPGRGHSAKAWVTCKPRDRPWGSRWPHGAASGTSVTAPSPVVQSSRLSAERGKAGRGLAGDPGPSSRPSSVCKGFLVLSFSCVESRGGCQPSPAAQGVGRAELVLWASLWVREAQQVWGRGGSGGPDHWLRRPCGGSRRPGPHRGSHPSLPREPVVPPGGHAQLPAGLHLGARVQQCAPSVRGAPGPGLGLGGRADAHSGVGDLGGSGSCSGLPTAVPTVPPQPGLGLQQVCVPGLGHCQQSPGQPQPEPGNRVSPHRRAAAGAQGAGLGLRHRGERAGDGCWARAAWSRGTCSPMAWGWWETRAVPQGCLGPSHLEGWSLPLDPLRPW